MEISWSAFFSRGEDCSPEMRQKEADPEQLELKWTLFERPITVHAISANLPRCRVETDGFKGMLNIRANLWFAPGCWPVWNAARKKVASRYVLGAALCMKVQAVRKANKHFDIRGVSFRERPVTASERIREWDSSAKMFLRPKKLALTWNVRSCLCPRYELRVAILSPCEMTWKRRLRYEFLQLGQVSLWTILIVLWFRCNR